MNITIFGGSGFIGQYLVRELVKRGNYRICIGDLKPPQAPPTEVEYFYCDIRKDISREICRIPDIVINLAALCTEPGYQECEYYATNTQGAHNVIKYCEATNCKTVWFTSSMSVYEYGDSPKFETTTPNPISFYGKSKLAAEKLHLAWLANDPERKLLIIRPAVIFGPGEHGNFTRLANALKSGYFIYPGRKNTIKANGYVEDLVDSILFMSERLTRYQLFNFAYPEVYTLENICHMICTIGNYSEPYLVAPPPFMYMLSKSFMVLNKLGLKNDIHPLRITKLISSTNIRPAVLLEHGYQFRSNLKMSLQKWFKTEPFGEFV